MKKLVLTLTATLACVAAFAQGKIAFVNDSVHLIYYTTAPTAGAAVLTGDVAGNAVSASGLTAGGAALSVDLMYGTSASSLSKLQTATVAGGTGTDGVWANTTITGLGSGTTYFFQVQVYDASAGSYAAASLANNKYYGESAVFTTTASTSITPNSIVSGTKSTWAAGVVPVVSNVGAGAMGAIAIQANVPEPTSLALLGLGAASLMIFRRRK